MSPRYEGKPTVPDDRMVANPDRRAARDELATAQITFAAAERSLAKALTDTTTTQAQKNTELPGLQPNVKQTTAAVATASQVPGHRTGL